MGTLNPIHTEESTLERSLARGDPHHQGLSTTSSTNDDDRPLIANDPHAPKDDDNNYTMDTLKKTKADKTCLEGEMLLENFVDEQILKAGIVTTGSETPSSLHRIPDNSYMFTAGRELRRMADQFELSYERRQVKEQADQIGLGIQNYAEFRKLLSALFNPGGITLGRIIVLFFFCSDVAIRSLTKGIDLFKRFMKWSIQYFAEHVCDWVRRNGGWIAVLSPHNMYPVTTIATIATVVICAFAIYRYFRN